MNELAIFACLYGVNVASMMTVVAIAYALFFRRTEVKKVIKILVKTFIKEMLKKVNETEDDK